MPASLIATVGATAEVRSATESAVRPPDFGERLRFSVSASSVGGGASAGAGPSSVTTGGGGAGADGAGAAATAAAMNRDRDMAGTSADRRGDYSASVGGWTGLTSVG